MPLTAEKYTGWLASDELEGDVVNLFMDYEPSASTSVPIRVFSTL